MRRKEKARKGKRRQDQTRERKTKRMKEGENETDTQRQTEGERASVASNRRPLGLDKSSSVIASVYTGLAPLSDYN